MVVITKLILISENECLAFKLAKSLIYDIHSKKKVLRNSTYDLKKALRIPDALSEFLNWVFRNLIFYEVYMQEIKTEKSRQTLQNVCAKN